MPPARPASGATTVLAVVMHELGHLVGLDHVDDPADTTYPETDPAVTAPEYGDGARRGLEELGDGPCSS